MIHRDLTVQFGESASGIMRQVKDNVCVLQHYPESILFGA